VLRRKGVSATSKSPRRIVLAALEVARAALPEYSHRFSPKKFTQPQLFACLVLKSSLKTDYRGVVEQLRDNPALVELLTLKQVPHFTTLQKASRRLLAQQPVQRLLDATVRQHQGRKRRIRHAAVDSTGLALTSASQYFIRRRERVGKPWKSVRYSRFGKLSVLCHTQTHFIVAFQERRGPMPDISDLKPLLTQALRRVHPHCLLADAGYDSESNHVFARQTCGVRTVIPAKHGKPSTRPARGHYRRLMQTRFHSQAYAERSQVETVISMIKRRQNSYLSSRHYWSERRELRLKALTHNIMILWSIMVFYRAGRELFSPGRNP